MRGVNAINTVLGFLLRCLIVKESNQNGIIQLGGVNGCELRHTNGHLRVFVRGSLGAAIKRGQKIETYQQSSRSEKIPFWHLLWSHRDLVRG